MGIKAASTRSNTRASRTHKSKQNNNNVFCRAIFYRWHESCRQREEVFQREIALFADSGSKAAADALLADYASKRAIVQQAPKAKSLASKKAKKGGGGFSLPSVSLPSISLPSVGSGKQKAAPAKKAKKARRLPRKPPALICLARAWCCSLRCFWSKPSLSGLLRD